MRAIQLLFLGLGACLAFDKARFQRTIEIREKHSNIHRFLFRSKEEQKSVARQRGHDGDPAQRNVFYHTPPLSTPAPIAPMTTAPATVAPVAATVAPIATTIAPVTIAPVTTAPVSIAPVIANQKSILKILIEDVPQSSILLAMVTALDLTLFLDSVDLSGPITVIAPTDSAFQDGLPPEDLAYFTELYQNPIWENHLACFILYHVLDGEFITTGNFTDGQLAGTLWVEETSVLLGTNPFSVNSIPLSQVDLLATNGVVQVISQMPLRLPCTGDSIYAQGDQSQELTTLISLVNTAGLETVFQNDAPMTLFAPTETAFGFLANDVFLFL
jgi:uncharacterized surface protein with fasciclin (FAS1) repeats